MRLEYFTCKALLIFALVLTSAPTYSDWTIGQRFVVVGGEKTGPVYILCIKDTNKGSDKGSDKSVSKPLPRLNLILKRNEGLPQMQNIRIWKQETTPGCANRTEKNIVQVTAHFHQSTNPADKSDICTLYIDRIRYGIANYTSHYKLTKGCAQ
jgi:hypothetical protein